MKEIEDRIQSYLYYGYQPESENNFSNLTDIDITANGSEYTPVGAATVLDEALNELLAGVASNDRVVVPISGGWDSRVLLGAALERFDRKQIKTLSFGVPGQLDFEVGYQIAKKFDLEHEPVDLSNVELKWGALLESVKESPWTYVPDGLFNRLAVTRVARSNKDIVLSGFMGEAQTGGHFSNATTRKEAIDEFIAKQRREKQFWLSTPGYDPRSALPGLPGDSCIPYSELLDFGIRQTCCIAPIVTPQKRLQGWGGDMGVMSSTGARVLAPFAHPKWAAYWFGVPKELKRGQKLYLEMMKYKFPVLAAMPSKYSWGLKPGQRFLQWLTYAQFGVRIRLHRRLPRLPIRSCIMDNYMDFQSAFRIREDYIEVARKAFRFLDDCGAVPWIDLGNLWDEHCRGKRDHALAIQVLIGLAVNLEVHGDPGMHP